VSRKCRHVFRLESTILAMGLGQRHVTQQVSRFYNIAPSRPDKYAFEDGDSCGGGISTSIHHESSGSFRSHAVCIRCRADTTAASDVQIVRRMKSYTNHTVRVWARSRFRKPPPPLRPAIPTHATSCSCQITCTPRNVRNEVTTSRTNTP
jgi:hypothetical protein